MKKPALKKCPVCPGEGYTGSRRNHEATPPHKRHATRAAAIRRGLIPVPPKHANLIRIAGCIETWRTGPFNNEMEPWMPGDERGLFAAVVQEIERELESARLILDEKWGTKIRRYFQDGEADYELQHAIAMSVEESMKEKK